MATFTGTAGDDSLLGTTASDVFHLEDGGDDSATGGSGSDAFYLGATLTADDRLDGGGGSDALVLAGDYAAGLVFATETMTSIGYILLTPGFSYRFSGVSQANVGSTLFVEGGALEATDSLFFDASAVHVGVRLNGGAGADELIGGSGANTLIGGGGQDTLVGGGATDSFTLGLGSGVHANGGGGDDSFVVSGPALAADEIDGGDGFDLVRIVGGAETPVVLGEDSLTDVEQVLIAVRSLHLTMADGNVAAGAVLRIDAMNASGHFGFDGSAETDGAFIFSAPLSGVSVVTGGAGADWLQGGAHADTLIGGAGDDHLDGLRGNDKLVGGLGRDALDGGGGAERFFYLDTADSTAAAPDIIYKLSANDVIWLRPIDADTTRAGDQAFHLVEAFTGHAGELVVARDRPQHLTTVSGDVDGDGTADLVIQIDGDHSDFTGFEL